MGCQWVGCSVEISGSLNSNSDSGGCWLVSFVMLAPLVFRVQTDIEGVVQHVRDEAEDQEDLEAHVDNQPGQQQHPLVISNSSTGQTENFQM